MRASVVIPTYNRLQDLQRVLSAIQSQIRPSGSELETVVVDDGSSDGTWEWLSSEADSRGLTVLHQSNAGPARARNQGVAAATGDLILFLGDDTEPQPGWLTSHLEEHRLFGARSLLAVIGYTSFADDRRSPFLRFINEQGAQFGYQLINDPRAVPFNFFYTSNVSVPRRVLLDLEGFREDFPAAAWEDIEFAYRAAATGLTLRYQPRARTLHRHCIRPRTFCGRQRTSGVSAAIFATIHPQLEDFLGVRRALRRRPLRSLRRVLLGLLVELGERVDGVVPPRIYRDFLDACYLDGLAEGLHSR
jgi:GT2 family glycosyltransferase